jgi:hypothetical protein
VRVDGRAPAGERERDGARELWLDLEAGRPRTIAVTARGGRPLPLTDPVELELRDERGGSER